MGSNDGNIYPQITQMNADLVIYENSCANLRNLWMDRVLKEILESVEV